ncbi:TSC22 domain family protein 4 isoform 1-T3 [Pholidichthys leucotaenia]
MSGGGKKRSGFQITSVTSDITQNPLSQSSPTSIVTVVQSEGSSSQPTTPSLKRKLLSHDALGQGAGSRFRVVKLAVSGGGRGLSYHRGRWMCTEFKERQEGARFRRVMDSMRHAHSLESLEMIGQDGERGGVLFQEPSHLSAQPMLHSGPPSPTHQEPINVRLLDRKAPIRTQGLDSAPPACPRNVPPLQLDVDAAGRSILRLSHSQSPSSPAGPYHRPVSPGQTPASFSLNQTIFTLPGVTSVPSSSSSSLVAIDNKIEQAMDLVKSHLMLAVREEVDLLRDQIRELQERNQQLETENHMLKNLTEPNTHNT